MIKAEYNVNEDRFEVTNDDNSLGWVDVPIGNQIIGLQRQVHSARYAFHQVCKTRYLEQVKMGWITKEQAKELYKESMRNYDSIIMEAVTGAHYDANQREMDKGFE